MTFHLLQMMFSTFAWALLALVTAVDPKRGRNRMMKQNPTVNLDDMPGPALDQIIWSSNDPSIANLRQSNKFFHDHIDKIGGRLCASTDPDFIRDLLSHQPNHLKRMIQMACMDGGTPLVKILQKGDFQLFIDLAFALFSDFDEYQSLNELFGEYVVKVHAQLCALVDLNDGRDESMMRALFWFPERLKTILEMHCRDSQSVLAKIISQGRSRLFIELVDRFYTSIDEFEKVKLIADSLKSTSSVTLIRGIISASTELASTPLNQMTERIEQFKAQQQAFVDICTSDRGFTGAMMSMIANSIIGYQIDVAGALIDLGAALNARFSHKPLLIFAINYGQYETAEKLVRMGADVNVRDVEGDETPLHAAAYDGASKLVVLLLARGAKVNRRNLFGETPLMFASTPDAARALLDAGANVNLRDKNGRTALMHTTLNDDWEVTQALIEAGAELDARDHEGKTALLLAVERIAYNYGSDAAKTLIDAGANINLQDNEGRTPLMCTSEQGAVLIAKKLLDAGADARMHDVDGRTALDYAFDSDAISRIWKHAIRFLIARYK